MLARGSHSAAEFSCRGVSARSRSAAPTAMCLLIALISISSLVSTVSAFTWSTPLREATQLPYAKSCGTSMGTWRPTIYSNDRWVGLCGKSIAQLSDATGTLTSIGGITCGTYTIDTGVLFNAESKLNDRVYLNAVAGDNSILYDCGGWRQRADLYKDPYNWYLYNAQDTQIAYSGLNSTVCKSGVESELLAYSRPTDTVYWRCGYVSGLTPAVEYYSRKGSETPKRLDVAPSGSYLNQIAAVWYDNVMNDTVYFITDAAFGSVATRPSLPTQLIRWQNNQATTIITHTSAICSTDGQSMSQMVFHPNGKSLFFSCRANGLWYVDLTAANPTFSSVSSCALGSGWAGSLSVTDNRVYTVCLSKQVDDYLDPTPSRGEVRAYTVSVDPTSGAASLSGDYAVLADSTTCSVGMASIDAQSSGVAGRPDSIWLGCYNYTTSTSILYNNLCGMGYALNITSDGTSYTCTQCLAGSHQSSWAFKSDTTCRPCGAGTFSSNPGAGNCTACASGSVSAAGSTSCTPCTVGYYGAPGSSSCVACEAGTYSAAQSSSCTACSVGNYSESTSASTTCHPCPVGSIAPEKSTQCSKCDTGSYSTPDGSACVACQAGTYFEKNSCTICAIGQYNPNMAALNCTQCDFPYTTNEVGSVNASQCVMPYCKPDLGINTLTCISKNPIPSSATSNGISLIPVILFQLMTAVVFNILRAL